MSSRYLQKARSSTRTLKAHACRSTRSGCCGDHAFTELDARLFDWPQRYTTEEYLGLLGTHSDHIMLPEVARERLFDGVRQRIDAAGGSFELGYQTLLCLARRRAT